MRVLLPLLFLSSWLWGSKILSYNLYDRTDRVDIMLTFDTPYEGAIRQSRLQDRIVVTLEEAVIDAPKVKSVTSSFVSKMTITPLGERTQIIVSPLAPIEMEASRTSDAFGLRLRFTTAVPAAENVLETRPAETTAVALPTRPDTAFSGSYIAVTLILIIGIAVVLWLRRRLPLPPNGARGGASWLFKGRGGTKDNVTVRFQKALDADNRVVMIEHGEVSYLVLLGSSNLLLDTFRGERPDSEAEFETVLRNRHEALDTFLRLDTRDDEPLHSYKQKASGLPINDL